MNTSPMDAIRHEINIFEAAVRNHAFKGAAHSADRPGIEAQYKAHRKQLEALIERNLK